MNWITSLAVVAWLAPSPAAWAANGHASPGVTAPSAPAIRLASPGGDLDFSWPHSVAAAAFVRAGKLWIAFDSVVDMELPEDVAARLPSLRRLPHPRLAVFQVDAAAPEPVLVEQAFGWSLLWSDTQEHPVVAPLHWPPENGELRVDGAATVDEIDDAVVGDRVGVVLLHGTGRAEDQSRSTPDVEIVPSLQGVVWRARVDGVTQRVVHETALISPPGGSRPLTVVTGTSMPLPGDRLQSLDPPVEDDATAHAGDPGDSLAGTGPTDKPHAEPDLADAASVPLPEELTALATPEPGMPAADIRTKRALRLSKLDLGSVGTVPDASIRERRRALVHTMTRARGADLLDDRLKLVRFLLAQGLGAEAGSALQGLPTGLEPATAAALEGVGQLLQGRAAEAGRLLGRPDLDGDPEIAWWRAAVAAERGDAVGSVAAFDAATRVPAEYPALLRLRLSLAEAGARLATSRPDRALAILDRLADETLSPRDRARVDLLRGDAHLARGEGPAADAAWKAAEQAGDPSTRARAHMAGLQRAVASGSLTATAALDRLANDRSGWRGLSGEAELMVQLGDLQQTAMQPDEALRTWREAAAYTTDPTILARIERKLAQQVAGTLAGNEGGTELSPAAALLVYRSNSDALPEGAALAETERRLAVRLANSGYDGPAQLLLDRGIGLGGSAPARAEAAAAIALGRLEERRPEEAARTLEAVRPERKSPTTTPGRQPLLLARVDREATRSDAIASFLPPADPATSRMRMALALRDKDWPAVAMAATSAVSAGSAAPSDIAALALAQARAGDIEGLAATVANFSGEPESGSLLAMLANPAGEAQLSAAGLADDAGWLRSTRAYLASIAAAPP